jgi:DNA-binding response OmpR family regulator
MIQMKKVTGSMLLASAITLGSIAAPSILAATTSNTATEEISEETKSALDEIRKQEDAGEITHEEAHENLVSQAFTIQEATFLFQTDSIDLILLDVLLPDGTGWDFLQKIRTHSPCPIIMLTALGDVPDRLRGLQNGADDYMSKPFVAEEVVARIQAVLRRPTRILNEIDALHFGKLRIHPIERQIFLHNEEVPLTPKDRALLLFLADHPNQNGFTVEMKRNYAFGDSVWGSPTPV